MMDNKRKAFFTITYFNQMVLAAVVVLPFKVPNDVTATNAQALVHPGPICGYLYAHEMEDAFICRE